MEVNPFKDPNIKRYEKISPMVKFQKTFRKFDIYAMPIALRYKGEKKFYTNFGAIVSLFLIVFMVAYTTYAITALSSQDSSGDITLTTADDFSSARISKTDTEGTAANFVFGFRIVDETGASFDYTNYLTIELETIYSIWSSVSNSYI